MRWTAEGEYCQGVDRLALPKPAQVPLRTVLAMAESVLRYFSQTLPSGRELQPNKGIVVRPSERVDWQIKPC